MDESGQISRQQFIESMHQQIEATMSRMADAICTNDWRVKPSNSIPFHPAFFAPQRKRPASSSKKFYRTTLV